MADGLHDHIIKESWKKNQSQPELKKHRRKTPHPLSHTCLMRLDTWLNGRGWGPSNGSVTFKKKGRGGHR